MRLRHDAHLLLGNKSVFLVSSRKGHLLGGGISGIPEPLQYGYGSCDTYFQLECNEKLLAVPLILVDSAEHV